MRRATNKKTVARLLLKLDELAARPPLPPGSTCFPLAAMFFLLPIRMIVCNTPVCGAGAGAAVAIEPPLLWLTFRPQDVDASGAIRNRCVSKSALIVLVSMWPFSCGRHCDRRPAATIVWVCAARCLPHCGPPPFHTPCRGTQEAWQGELKRLPWRHGAGHVGVAASGSRLSALSMCFDTVVAVEGMSNFDWNKGFTVIVVARAAPGSTSRDRVLVSNIVLTGKSAFRVTAVFVLRCRKGCVRLQCSLGGLLVGSVCTIDVCVIIA